MERKLKRLDGIIFDVDGTLWDATFEGAASWSHTIKANSELNLQLCSADLKRVFGQPMDRICDALFPMISREERLTLGGLCFEEEIGWLQTHHVPLYPHVAEVFRDLSTRVPLFIVSNCQSGYIEVMMETNQLGAYVSGHLCFGDTGLEKWETLKKLMDQHQLERVVYVGDTQGDYDTCQKIDIPFVFASWGYGEVPEAKLRIDDMQELPTVLELENLK